MDFKNILGLLGRGTIPGILYSWLEPIWKGSDSFLGQIFNKGKSLFDSASSTGIVDEVGDYVESYLNKMSGAHQTGAEIEQNQYTAMREDTRFQRNVADMQAAGLNPALIYGSSAASPSVNSSASGIAGSGGIADFLQLAMLPLQMKAVKADIEKTKADTENTKADTAGTLLSNEWINRENQAKLDSQRSGIELNESTIAEKNQMITESKQRIVKMISETDEVEARKELEISQKLLNQANARRIEELLPFEKLYMEAETDAEKASASQALVHAAYENGLLTSGIIEFSARKEQAESVIADVRAQVADDKYHADDDTKADKVCRVIASGIRRCVMMVSGK